MLNTNERIIKHKVGLLNLAEELGNVSKSCQVMGLSRDTFYRYKSAVEEGGVEALLVSDRRKPNPKNRVEPKIVGNGSGLYPDGQRLCVCGSHHGLVQPQGIGLAGIHVMDADFCEGGTGGSHQPLWHP